MSYSNVYSILSQYLANLDMNKLNVLNEFIESKAYDLLRISLGVVYIWFGVPKLLSQSSIEHIIRNSYTFIPYDIFQYILGVGEVAIGLSLLFSFFLPLFIPLIWMHILGTFGAVVLNPSMFVMNNNPLILSLEGEFVIKNLILLSSAFVLYKELVLEKRNGKI